MIRSKYTYWAYLPLLYIIGLIPLLYVMISFGNARSYFIWYLLVSGIFLLLMWLSIVEIGKKLASIKIYEDRFEVAGFLRLLSSRTIKFKDVDGFRTASISGDWEKHEVLYVIAGGKKVTRLSELYCQNYYELKKYISARFKNLGDDYYNFFY
jgi:hypothetical protein